MGPQQVRSRTIQVALGAHWIGLALLVSAAVGWSRFGGSWLIGSALLAGLLGLGVGWIAALVAISKDRGRIALGAICLALYPLVAALLWALSLSSTRAYVHDPIMTITWLLVALGLGLGTLLICLPAELGT